MYQRDLQNAPLLLLRTLASIPITVSTLLVSLRAVWVNIVHSGVSEGGSTITQQLARNAFLSQDRTFKRKISEALLALKIE